MPPLVVVAWQVGLGCFVMLVLGVTFEHPDYGAITPTAASAADCDYGVALTFAQGFGQRVCLAHGATRLRRTTGKRHLRRFQNFQKQQLIRQKSKKYRRRSRS